MLECTFELNGKAMSALRCGALAFPAFSGLDHHKNRPEFSCYASTGPIPRGTYYVVDRQSGGMLGSIRDSLRNKNEWFALYAVDGKIDDEAFCNAIRRGEFRLHPKGGQGISKGCITVESHMGYHHLRSLLKAQRQHPVPGTTLKAYGRVIVR
ncbi:hypothetical protein LMG19282_03379 [Cupriavidus campinensis]|jgi:hypothetical protein|uniref:DUF2778 domain-containing protein n=1 Tax=Cupriavidus campinensis TaxID=151783 RepID=A0AAE9I0I7_9BURK|nr:DUF2778 domain-containing protein [Cupriavidus campinensis]URF04036.1 DUF2778 domain-containing protein [Cupriavidus campinensis]CAG2148551.1 hypothetical protein LMG19282_03379 [Cupriavidus campinensis]